MTSTGLFTLSITFIMVLPISLTGEVILLLAITIRSTSFLLRA